MSLLFFRILLAPGKAHKSSSATTSVTTIIAKPAIRSFADNSGISFARRANQASTMRADKVRMQRLVMTSSAFPLLPYWQDEHFVLHLKHLGERIMKKKLKSKIISRAVVPANTMRLYGIAPCSRPGQYKRCHQLLRWGHSTPSLDWEPSRQT